MSSKRYSCLQEANGLSLFNFFVVVVDHVFAGFCFPVTGRLIRVVHSA